MLFPVLPAFGQTLHLSTRDCNTCMRTLQAAEDGIRHSRIYYGCFFVFAYVLPLSIISILYGLMVRRLLYGVTSGGHRSCTKSAGETARTKRRVTRLVVIVVVVFAACWLPLQSVFVVQYVAGYPDHGTQFVVTKIIASCLAYTNSCVNPFLYAFLSDAFRKSFCKVLCCLLPEQRSLVTGRDLNKQQRAVGLQLLPPPMTGPLTRSSRDLVTPSTAGGFVAWPMNSELILDTKISRNVSAELFNVSFEILA